MTACPHCGQPMPESAPDPAAELREWCKSRGYWVGPGGTVTEAVAAEALGRQPNTLRSWRSTDRRLPYRNSGGRIRYMLADIAAFAAGENK